MAGEGGKEGKREKQGEERKEKGGKTPGGRESGDIVGSPPAY